MCACGRNTFCFTLISPFAVVDWGELNIKHFIYHCSWQRGWRRSILEWRIPVLCLDISSACTEILLIFMQGKAPNQGCLFTNPVTLHGWEITFEVQSCEVRSLAFMTNCMWAWQDTAIYLNISATTVYAARLKFSRSGLKQHQLNNIDNSKTRSLFSKKTFFWGGGCYNGKSSSISWLVSIQSSSNCVWWVVFCPWQDCARKNVSWLWYAGT